MNNIYSWTREAWSSALPIFDRIINLQFIKELSDGTLPVEKFRSYIAQDELYLGNYGRQMFEFAAMMEDASSLYTINTTKLLRYAGRRNCRAEFERVNFHPGD